MGRSMWSQGKGFAKVGALYSGSECIIEGVSPLPSPPLAPLCSQQLTLSHEQYRAKNDIYNSVYAGLFSGAVLGRNSGVRAMLFGGVGFAIFSGAIDLYMRKEKPDEDA